MDPTFLIFMLIAGHALGDFALQNDYIATKKGENSVDGGIVLFAHGMIHGGIVALITNSLSLAFIEVLAHCIIDRAKTSGRIDFKTDQMLHILCKVLYVFALA